MIGPLLVVALLGPSPGDVARASAAGRPATEAAVLIALNCGGGAVAGSDGVSYGFDQFYSPGGYGADGGTTYVLQHPIGGHPDMALYTDVRRGASFNYRFDVPAAHYIVTIGFVDLLGFGVGQNRCDVAIEGQTVLDEFDIHAQVGREYALRRSFRVNVVDGRLDVSFIASVGVAQVGSIVVRERAADAVPPPIPTDVRALGSYGRNLVIWDPSLTTDDLAGYVVQRSASPGGPFVPLAGIPTVLRRAYDDSVAALSTWFYRVAAEDVFGNRSTFSPVVNATVRHPDGSSLPRYEITIEPEDLAALNADIFSDEYVPCIFRANGMTYPAGIHYRGFSQLGFAKNPLKIRLDNNLTHDGRSRFNLNPEFVDRAIVRQMLAYSMARDAGAPVPFTRFVRLMMNGEYVGMYCDLEELDEHFLERTGRNPASSVYRANSNLRKLSGPLSYPPNYPLETPGLGTYEDLIAFIDWLDSSSDTEIADHVDDWVDVESYFGYYASIIASQNVDFSSRNYYLIRDADSGRWEFVPWDLDMSFGKFGTLTYDYVHNRAINLGTIGNLDYTGPGYNVLLDRMLRGANLRWYYADHALELLDSATGPLAPARMIARAESLATVIRDDVERDMKKWGWEDMEVFDQGLADLTAWIANRGAFLGPALGAYRPAYVPRLRMNEIQTRNVTTILDQAGDPDPWLEIVVSEPFPLALSRWRLSDQPGNPTLWPLPAGTLSPREMQLFWADGETGEGPDHAPFVLQPGGGLALLTWTGGATPVIADAVSYGSIPIDRSLARRPDGTGAFGNGFPTPNALNSGGPNGPPEITETQQFPSAPGASDSVVVKARVTDEDGIGSVTLVVRVNHGAETRPAMLDDGLHGDGSPGDGVYGARLAPVATGSVVDYYVEAVDALFGLSRDPLAAPSVRYRYLVGFVDPLLRLNELMAANDTTITDEFGEFEDWIEIANVGLAPVNLSSFYLTDNLADTDKWRLPALPIAPQQHFLIWADGEPSEGVLHASFRLERNGEVLGFFQRVGSVQVMIDSVSFGFQADDVAFGRFPDGTGPWMTLLDPTPGATNEVGVGVGETTAPAPAALGLRAMARASGRVALEAAVPHAGPVDLRVFDVSGRLTRRLFANRWTAGVHRIDWDGRNDHGQRAASGVYFFRLEAGDRVALARGVLVR